MENSGKLEVKTYPRNQKQPNSQQPKLTPPNRPSCKRNTGLKFNKGYYC